MMQNQNQDDVFRILEHADEETSRVLSEQYQAASPEKMEELLRRSEEKYLLKQKQPRTVEISKTSPTIRSPGERSHFYGFLSAAVCLTLSIGAVTIWIQRNPPPAAVEDSGSSVYETSCVIRETTSTPSTVQTTAASTVQAPSTSSVNVMVSTTEPHSGLPTALSEIPDSEPEASAAEPELPPSTEPMTDPTEAPVTDAETAPPDEPSIPGFLVEQRFYPEAGEQAERITAVPEENAPDSLIQHFEPGCLPEGYLLQNTAQSEGMYSQIYQNEQHQHFTLHQFTLHEFAAEFSVFDDMASTGMIFVRTLETVNGAPGFSYEERMQDSRLGYFLYWKQDGYVLWLETYTLSPEEVMQIAESVQPVP